MLLISGRIWPKRATANWRKQRLHSTPDTGVVGEMAIFQQRSVWCGFTEFTVSEGKMRVLREGIAPSTGA